MVSDYINAIVLDSVFGPIVRNGGQNFIWRTELLAYKEYEQSDEYRKQERDLLFGSPGKRIILTHDNHDEYMKKCLKNEEFFKNNFILQEPGPGLNGTKFTVMFDEPLFINPFSKEEKE